MFQVRATIAYPPARVDVVLGMLVNSHSGSGSAGFAGAAGGPGRPQAMEIWDTGRLSQHSGLVHKIVVHRAGIVRRSSVLRA